MLSWGKRTNLWKNLILILFFTWSWLIVLFLVKLYTYFLILYFYISLGKHVFDFASAVCMPQCHFRHTRVFWRHRW